MELKLKSISPEGVDAALSKAELYRFLNEPEEAESICQDVLVAQPGHQLALRKESRRLRLYCSSTTMTSVANLERYLSKL